MQSTERKKLAKELGMMILNYIFPPGTPIFNFQLQALQDENTGRYVIVTVALDPGEPK